MITADASDVFWFGKRRYYIGFHDFTTSNALHEFVNHQKQARFTLAVGKIRSSEAERERDYAFPSALRKAQARDPINKLRKHFLSSWARTLSRLTRSRVNRGPATLPFCLTVKRTAAGP